MELKAGEELAVILNNLGGTSKLEANFRSWIRGLFCLVRIRMSICAGSGSV
jgi:hypothetical protein